LRVYRYSNFGQGLSGYRWSPMVKNLIIINCIVFLLEFIPVFDIVGTFGLVPALVTHKFFLWQLLTYMFLHGGFFHLLFNMFILWMFGSEIEKMWGSREFLRYYFITGIGAGILTVLTSWNSMIPTIGASGAIYGILVAFAVLFPNRLIYLYFLFPIKAKHLVIIFVVIELYASLHSSNTGIANIAHLGGMLVGYFYIKGNRHFGSLFDRTRDMLQKGRIKIRVVDDEVSGQGNSTDDIEDDEIDRILDKITEEGIGNLTEEEKEILNKASEHLRRKR
jgi:membrane associated rhomboid family serine protease